jgi:hypothetical protein
MLRATFQTQRIDLENVAKGTAEHRLALLNDARFLLSLREELQTEEQRLADRRMAQARDYLGREDPTRTEDHRDDD